MNSISACDGRGSVARVDAGSFLLGWPGAPGCTTTGLDAFACCARAEAGKKTEQTLETTRNPDSNADPVPVRSPCLRQILQGFHFVACLNIFRWNFRFDLPVGTLIHPRLFRSKQIEIVAGWLVEPDCGERFMSETWSAREKKKNSLEGTR
jgi:hypothetical protein